MRTTWIAPDASAEEIVASLILFVRSPEKLARIAELLVAHATAKRPRRDLYQTLFDEVSAEMEENKP